MAVAESVLANENARDYDVLLATANLKEALKGLKLKENTEDESQPDQEEDNKTNQGDDKRTDQKAAETGDTSTVTLAVILLAAGASAGLGSYCLYQRKKR